MANERCPFSTSPPERFSDKLKLMGPGILLAAAAIGSGELILTPRAGALFGLSIAWVIILSIIYKLTLTVGLARYTIATGEDIFEGFSHLPGPCNWFVWILGLMFLVGAVGYSGIALACGSALHVVFPALSMIQWAAIVVVLICIFVLRGGYAPIEKVAFALAFILLCGVAYSLAALGPNAGWFFREIAPSLPKGAGQTVVSLLGWTAGGTSTLVYSFWILEKGIALPKRSHSTCADASGHAEDARKLKNWLSLIHLDVGLSYLLMMFVSLAFLTIGALVLSTAGPDGGPLVPAKEETALVLSRLLAVAGGPLAQYVFLIAAFAILCSTIIGLVDGKSRGLRTAIRIIFPRSSRISDRACYRLFAAIMCLIIFAFLFTGRPVVLIMLISAVEAPVLSISAIMLIYLFRTRLRPENRPGPIWHLLIVTGTVVYLSLSAIVLFRVVGELLT